MEQQLLDKARVKQPKLEGLNESHQLQTSLGKTWRSEQHLQQSHIEGIRERNTRFREDLLLLREPRRSEWQQMREESDEKGRSAPTHIAFSGFSVSPRASTSCFKDVFL
jgi:hypothetical protein